MKNSLVISHHLDNKRIPCPAIALCCPYCTFHMPFLFREASTFVIPQSRLPLLFRRAPLSYFTIWTVLFWTRAYPQPITRESNLSTKQWRLIEGKPDWMMTDEINQVEKTEDVYENWRRRMNRDRRVEGSDEAGRRDRRRRSRRRRLSRKTRSEKT